MNQQTLMAVPGAYPAPKASDDEMWRALTRACVDEELVRLRNVPQISADAAACAQSVMAKNLEKILSTTRTCWSVQLRAQRRHEAGTVPDRAEQ